MSYFINSFSDICGFVVLVLAIPALFIAGFRLWIYMQDKKIDWQYKRQADEQTLRQQKLMNDSQEIENQQQIQNLALVKFNPSEPVLPRQQLLEGQYSEAMLVLAAKYLETLKPVANVPTTLTYSPHIVSKSEGKLLESQPDVKQLPELKVLDFGELYNQHLLPKNEFLLGANVDGGEFVTATWKQMYSTLIGGGSGSGKSTLVRSILAQAALQNSKFMVIDPHYGAGEESLGESLKPLQHKMLTAVATNDAQMLATLNTIRDIAKNRLDGVDKDKTPVVLVVDETTGLLQRGAIREPLLEVLGYIAQETRKVAVYAICIGQMFTSQIMPSEVRNCFVNFISCRSRKDNARYMTSNSQFAAIVESLSIGQCVRMSPSGEVQILSFPNCTQQHLEMVAGTDGTFRAITDTTSTTSHTGENVEIQADFDDSGSGSEAVGKRSGSGFGSGQNDARSQRIIDLFCQGVGKNEMIRDLEGKEITGGRRYQLLVDEIDTTIRNYVLQLQNGGK